jgi:hypothetical protein
VKDNKFERSTPELAGDGGPVVRTLRILRHSGAIVSQYILSHKICEVTAFYVTAF